MKTIEKVKQLAELHPTWSSRMIANEIGVTRATVVHHYHTLGIVRDRKQMQKLNNTCRDKPIIISEKAEQVILGSILGDGTITKNRPSNENTRLRLNSCLTISHGVGQYDYLQYKIKILEEEGIKGYLKEVKPVLGTRSIKGIPLYTRGGFIYKSIRNSSFNKYRILFYKNKKYINKYIYKLSALGLAIWYLDDGCLYKKVLRLYTNSFSEDDLRILQDVLLKKFNIKSSLQRSSNIGKIIYIRAKSLETFLSIIKPFVPDSMKYKLGT